jgi:hypothetical protein
MKRLTVIRQMDLEPSHKLPIAGECIEKGNLVQIEAGESGDWVATASVAEVFVQSGQVVWRGVSLQDAESGDPVLIAVSLLLGETKVLVVVDEP